MVDTRSFLCCYLFFIIRSAFLGFFFSLRSGKIHHPDDVAGVGSFFLGQVFSVQVSDSQKPEEAGLQHSKVYIFFLSAFWFMWTYLLVMRYMLFKLFQVFHVMRTCTAMISSCRAVYRKELWPVGGILSSHAIQFLIYITTNLLIPDDTAETLRSPHLPRLTNL